MYLAPGSTSKYLQLPPRIEISEVGRVILTLERQEFKPRLESRPEHHFTVEGRGLNSWCARMSVSVQIASYQGFYEVLYAFPSHALKPISKILSMPYYVFLSVDK